MVGKGTSSAFLFLLVALIAILPSSAQIQNAVAQPLFDLSTTEDNAGGVYVRDSAIALEKLALARRMERLHEWGKSADVYQEILEKYPDRVVPSAEDPKTHIVIQYASVTQTVCQSLCKWPVEGLTVYRSRYETAAAKILAGNEDSVSKLHQVFSLYFPSDTAKAAGIRLMDIYFEQGDYSAVAQIGRKLLDWHPNLLAERPRVLYRTAIAEKLTGQVNDDRRCLDELRQHFPQATGSVRGQDVLLADSLEKELADAAIVRGATSDSWLTVGGDASRSKISFSRVKPGARLYSIALPQLNWKQFPDLPQRESSQRIDQEQRKKGAGLGIMPAVDHGQLFFQDNTRVYAVDLDSGVPLQGWIDTYPMQNGVYKLPGNPPPVPLSRQLCITLNDKYVTAVMGLSDPVTQFIPPQAQESRLVCLDRKTGKEIWNLSLGSLPDAQSALRDLQMGGAPLIVADNLYVIAHGDKGQFDDCYVLCFALSTGQFRWASFIANSNKDISAFNFPEESMFFPDASSHIAYASGRLFVVTDLGAVASLDAYTGTIIWLDVYRTESPAIRLTGFNPAVMRGLQPPGQNGMLSATASVPWTHNPAVVQNGKLFILPGDGRSLFIYDADSGDLVKKIPLADLRETSDPSVPSTPDVPSTLLAVNDDLIYLAGSRQVWQVPWRSISPDKPADFTPRYWRSADGIDTADGDDQLLEVRGRAFVTGDAVYLPTQKCLLRILLSTGKLDSVTSSFPRPTWDVEQEGPGNVVVTQDHVIVAGDRQVAVYTDILLARARLDREIAVSPVDPDVRLHYAEVMFAAGQPDVAQDKLEEAFQLLGGMDSLRIGAGRDRAFEDAISFSWRLREKPESVQQVDRLFDMARAAASTAAQQVRYRILRAAFDASRTDRNPAAAIELYQQILADPAFRVISMPDPQNGVASQAGAVAAAAIQQILTTPEGRQAYEKFEQTAADKFREAKAAADPDQFLDLAKVYPNSRIASQAMFSAADLYESRGKSRMATQVLRQLVPKSYDQDRAAVLEALARNYLKMPNHTDVALSRLALAAALAPTAMLRQPMPLPDGTVMQNISLATARDVLMHCNAKASTDLLPDLHLPTHDQYKTYLRSTGQRVKPFQPDSPSNTIAGVDALVVPIDGFSQNDRIIAWAATSGLSVYPVGQNKPLFTCPTFNDSPAGAAWTDSNLLAWTKESMTSIDGVSGRTRWNLDLSAMPAITVPSDAPAAGLNAAQAPEQIVQVKPIGDRILVATSIGRIAAVDAPTGHVAWQTRVSSAVDNLLANDDFTVVRFQDGQSVELQVFNTFTGELVGRKAFSLENGIVPINLALAADGTLAYTLPNQLCIQDLFEANLSEQGMDPHPVTDPSPSQVFQGVPQANQLLIHGGRVFAVANAGKEVRIFSVDSAAIWRFSAPREKGFAGIFNTYSTSTNVTIHISGNYLFVLSPRRLTAYRIDPPTSNWETADPTQVTNYEQILFAKDYVAVVDRPGERLTESNRAGTRLTLNLFIRFVKSLPDGESGALVFQYDLPILQDTFALQPVEGGIAFFTGHTIQTFLGARDTVGNIPPI